MRAILVTVGIFVTATAHGNWPDGGVQEVMGALKRDTESARIKIADSFKRAKAADASGKRVNP